MIAIGGDALQVAFKKKGASGVRVVTLMRNDSGYSVSTRLEDGSVVIDTFDFFDTAFDSFSNIVKIWNKEDMIFEMEEKK